METYKEDCHEHSELHTSHQLFSPARLLCNLATRHIHNVPYRDAPSRGRGAVQVQCHGPAHPTPFPRPGLPLGAIPHGAAFARRSFLGRPDLHARRRHGAARRHVGRRGGGVPWRAQPGHCRRHGAAGRGAALHVPPGTRQPRVRGPGVLPRVPLQGRVRRRRVPQLGL
jgi:hypothetical protein